MIKRNIFRRTILISLFIILFSASTFIGILDIKLIDLLKLDREAWHNFLYFRIPRSVSIVLASAGLAVAGIIMQAISQNKFISPTTSGTISATQLGMLVALLLFPMGSSFVKFGFAFISALIFSIFLMVILNKIKIKNIIYLPLIGMMYGSIISSITSVLAGMFGKLQTVQSWNVGSFTLLVKGRYELLYIIFIPVLLAYIYATKFSIVGMGEDFSKNLGINYKSVILLGLVLVSIISSLTYIIVGPLPFLGLIIPNIITLIYGDNLKKSMIDIIFLSAIYILICDILSRTIRYPYEIPISFVAGVFGSLIFIIILFGRVKYGSK